jgi:polysaccharide biosynthesis/export protein
MNRLRWLLSCAVLVASGCGATQQAKRRPDAGAAQAYRIGPEDVLEISVWNNETVSRTVQVRPDGMVSLPLVNDVRAAGMTPMELRGLLRMKLAHYIPNPEVSVIVREIHSAKVSVVGEVAHPGRYELRGPVTLLDIIANAGGMTEFADRDEITILRQSEQGLQRITIDHDDLVRGKPIDQDVYLYAGDVVVVP